MIDLSFTACVSCFGVWLWLVGNERGKQLTPQKTTKSRFFTFRSEHNRQQHKTRNTHTPEGKPWCFELCFSETKNTAKVCFSSWLFFLFRTPQHHKQGTQQRRNVGVEGRVFVVLFCFPLNSGGCVCQVLQHRRNNNSKQKRSVFVVVFVNKKPKPKQTEKRIASKVPQSINRSTNQSLTTRNVASTMICCFQKVQQHSPTQSLGSVPMFDHQMFQEQSNNESWNFRCCDHHVVVVVPLLNWKCCCC